MKIGDRKMLKPKTLQEIRAMKFEDVYERRAQRSLTIEEAAEILGVCERTFRRWCESYEEEGMEGLLDKRLGKRANNAAPVDEVIRMTDLYQTKYADFDVKHFYDIWKRAHKGTRSYTWVKNKLQSQGLAKKAKKRGAHRKRRLRRPMEGMMMLQDGSTHQWVQDKVWDLIITIDDASSKVCSGFFMLQEGTESSFRGVKEVIEKYGIFCSLYTDRGSHYWNTPHVGGKVDKSNLTQFGRAMQKLGIEMIPSYSPEARGRIERMFQTLQKRLPKELRAAGITDMEEANIFLTEIFWPEFNRLFSVKPQSTETAFVPWLENAGHKLEDILCVQEKRMVAKDNTVSYKTKILQIPADKERYSYARTQVTVHERIDGTLVIFYGPRRLGYYNKEGMLLRNAG